MLHLMHLLYTSEREVVGVRRTAQINPVIYARSLVRLLAVSACVLYRTMGRVPSTAGPLCAAVFSAHLLKSVVVGLCSWY